MRGKALLTGTLIAAVGLSGAATAHTFSAPTSLTINVADRDRVIDRGEIVRFSGKLRSRRPRCRRFKKVQLIRFRDRVVVGADQTNRRGFYEIFKRVRKTNKFYTRFRGRVGGVHPHRHVCQRSRSRNVRIRVR